MSILAIPLVDVDKMGKPILWVIAYAYKLNFSLKL